MSPKEKALEYLREKYPNYHAFPADELEYLEWYFFMQGKIAPVMPQQICDHLDTWSHSIAYGPCTNTYDVRAN